MLILVLLGLLLPAGPLSAQPGPDAEKWVSRGNDLYYRGEYQKALQSYEKAVSLSSESARAWLNGAVVLEETGQPRRAARWYRKAAALTMDPAVANALGWAQWRDGDLQAAATSFQRVLARKPDHAYALLGLARVDIDSGRPEEALKLLQRAAEAAPLLNLAAYYRGNAYELLGEHAAATEAYRQAVIADSYFTEGRDALGRAYMRKRRYRDAWRQFAKLLEAEPRSRRFRSLMAKIRPLLSRAGGSRVPGGLRLPLPYLVESEPGDARVPRLRVGIGSNPRGIPRARRSLSFQANADFVILDAATRKELAAGDADETWQVRLKRSGKRQVVVVLDPEGKAVLQNRQGVLIRPRPSATGALALLDVTAPGSAQSLAAAGKLLRGDLEVSVYRGNLRLVNALDLENYTHGVVSAEMPIQSPLEALKAQAVVARSHALFIKNVTRRHRREGYDLCDEQHCQVYAGIRAESKRSREIVNATRGRIVTYKGKVAHVIYSSNCGGHTQNGKDLTGWGDVPYWTGISDGNDLGPRPRSPWELRLWLTSWPQAYCKPSSYVFPAHFRWTRIIPVKDLEEKLRRKFAIGRLLGLRPLRRSPAGNVNILLIQGTDRSVRIDSEMQIRGLLGLGSLRSTLFVIDTEYGRDRKPSAYLFHGGGWGHGVGLCQSGAMGRAEAGQTYEQIIRAYFKGTDLAQLRY